MAQVTDSEEKPDSAAVEDVEVGSMLLCEYIKAHRTSHINSVVDQGEEYVKIFREHASQVERCSRDHFDRVLKSIQENIRRVESEIMASEPTKKSVSPPDQPQQRQTRRPRGRPIKAAPLEAGRSPKKQTRTRRRK